MIVLHWNQQPYRVLLAHPISSHSSPLETFVVYNPVQSCWFSIRVCLKCGTNETFEVQRIQRDKQCIKFDAMKHRASCRRRRSALRCQRASRIGAVSVLVGDSGGRMMVFQQQHVHPSILTVIYWYDSVVNQLLVHH